MMSSSLSQLHIMIAPKVDLVPRPCFGVRSMILSGCRMEFRFDFPWEILVSASLAFEDKILTLVGAGNRLLYHSVGRS